jgi:hypothetical protein
MGIYRNKVEFSVHVIRELGFLFEKGILYKQKNPSPLKIENFDVNFLKSLMISEIFPSSDLVVIIR